MHLLAVAHEPGLHEQLHVATLVGAGDMEPGAAPLGAIPQQVLDQPEPDVARRRTLVDRALVHGVELHDGPLVAGVVGLHAGQAGQPAVLLVDVQRVVRLERAEGHPEQAEDAHLAGRDGQAQRTHGALALIAAGVGPAGQLAQRGKVGQPRRAHPSGTCAHHRATRRRAWP